MCRNKPIQLAEALDERLEGEHGIVWIYEAHCPSASLLYWKDSCVPHGMLHPYLQNEMTGALTELGGLYCKLTEPPCYEF